MESDANSVPRRIHNAAATLATPLPLPNALVGSRVSVYWAGDQQWYEATVMKLDFVNNALLLRYDDDPSGDETQWEWEPALMKSMKFMDRPRNDALSHVEASTSKVSTGDNSCAGSTGAIGSVASERADDADAPGEGKSESNALNLSRLTPFNEQCIGRLVAVYWENHGLWYDGTVQEYDSAAGKHSILYSDDSCSWVNLRTAGRFLSDTKEGDAMILEQRKTKGIIPKGPQALALEQQAAAEAQRQQQMRMREHQRLILERQQGALQRQGARHANSKKRPHTVCAHRSHPIVPKDSPNPPPKKQQHAKAAKISNRAVKALLSIMTMDNHTERDKIQHALAQAAKHLKLKDEANLAAINAITSDLSRLDTDALKLAVRRLFQPPDGFENLQSTPHLLVGRRVLIFWPGDEQWYPGRVGGYVDGASEHGLAGMHRIDYDDGESYQHDLREAAYRFEK
eukprot:SAG31_NODE_750_length_12362_cov_6.912827_8_plen_456_part_00